MLHHSLAYFHEQLPQAAAMARTAAPLLGGNGIFHFAEWERSGSWMYSEGVYQGELRPIGSLDIAREIEGDRVRYDVRYVRTIGPGVSRQRNVIEARCQCRNDPLRTPLGWEMTYTFVNRRFRNSRDVQFREEAVVEGNEIRFRRGGAAHRVLRTRRVPALAIALLDAVPSLPRDPDRRHEFSLIDDFQFLTEPQHLEYRGAAVQDLAGEEHRLHVFRRAGGPEVPAYCWLTEEGVLLAQLWACKGWLLTATAEGAVDQAQLQGATERYFGQPNPGRRKIGQVFVPTRARLRSISLKPSPVNGPVESAVQLRLYAADARGAPQGEPLASADIPAADWNRADGTEAVFPLPASLRPGQPHVFVLGLEAEHEERFASAIGSLGTIRVRRDGRMVPDPEARPVDEYPRGHIVEYRDGAWSPFWDPLTDLYFRTFA